MVYRTICPDLKRRALYLLLEEGWEIDQITAMLDVMYTRWEHNYESHGSVNPPTPLRGCRQFLSSDITEELHELLVETGDKVKTEPA